MKKFRASGKDDLVLCLESMREKPAAVETNPPSDEREWLRRMSRGNLFEVTDVVFEFFLTLEQYVGTSLPQRLSGNVGRMSEFLSELKGREDLLEKWTVCGGRHRHRQRFAGAAKRNSSPLHFY